ncbi:MAG: hypothetical protein F6K10_20530 [Moorea sp. SIO2B7]|nr:hypothetical protein [Moorena sp. SIO2B7]
MSYSEFTIEQLVKFFNITFQEQVKLFENIEPVEATPLLKEILVENIPLAIEINTEKARSEMIVAPILIEIRKKFNRQISLFSGRDFTVDKDKGLTGRCDFLISSSSLQLEITSPVAVLVEAKNDNLQSGIPQCIAEMIAAQIFNQKRENNIACIYGGVTTGSLWQFMKLENNMVYLEGEEHFIGNIESILGIISLIIKETSP